MTQAIKVIYSHPDLSDLDQDGHPQYLLASGSRDSTGRQQFNLGATYGTDGPGEVYLETISNAFRFVKDDVPQVSLSFDGDDFLLLNSVQDMRVVTARWMDFDCGLGGSIEFNESSGGMGRMFRLAASGAVIELETSLDGNKITDLADGVDPQDAVTMNQISDHLTADGAVHGALTERQTFETGVNLGATEAGRVYHDGSYNLFNTVGHLNIRNTVGTGYITLRTGNRFLFQDDADGTTIATVLASVSRMGLGAHSPAYGFHIKQEYNEGIRLERFDGAFSGDIAIQTNRISISAPITTPGLNVGGASATTGIIANTLATRADASGASPVYRDDTTGELFYYTGA